MRGMQLPIKCLVFISLILLIAETTLGSEPMNPPQILIHAAQCLVAKNFIALPDQGQMNLGYFIDNQSYPEERVIYVVEYTENQKASHSASAGTVFSLFYSDLNGKKKYDIQNNASFTITGNNIEFRDPPLGGIWTQQHLVSAIKHIAKRTNFLIPIKSLTTVEPTVQCGSYANHGN
jgi:hypothetical protein